MADQQKMDTPASAAPNTEPLIFTMPEKYRGGALSTNAPPAPVPPPPKAAAAPILPPPPPPPPRPVVKPGTPAKKRGMPTSTKILIAVGFIVVLALGGIGIWVWMSIQPPQVANVQPPGNTTNHPVNNTPANHPPTNTPPTNTPPVNSPPFTGQLVPGRDSDSDGLTDVEETLYGTNARLPDTDADSFLDGNEVFHTYNPRGTAPGTLLESGLAKAYTDGIYSMLYPAAWSVKPVTGQPTGAVFVVPSGETITVSTESKDASMSLADWYVKANPGASPATLTSSQSLNGYAMLVTQDQLAAYLDLGTSVVTVSYATGVKPTIDYLTTFQMMTNSVLKL